MSDDGKVISLARVCADPKGGSLECSMVRRDKINSQGETTELVLMAGDHPMIVLPDASFLLFAEFSKVGFDLVITLSLIHI